MGGFTYKPLKKAKLIYGDRRWIFFQRFYLFMRDTEREAETQAKGEAGSMQEPDMGLDPRTPGSCPESKADA